MPPRARGCSRALATQNTTRPVFPEPAAAPSQPLVTPVHCSNAQNAAPPCCHHPVGNTSSEGEFDTLLDSYSNDLDEPEPPFAPAHPIALGSPVKQAWKATNNYTALYHKSDLEAWEYEDEAIVDDYTLGNMVHLVLDGWTAPVAASYLGLVVVWYAGGKIHHAVLEFVKLTQSHTGKYLAEVTAECLLQYGLAERYCHFAWIMQIFISFFFKKPKHKQSADNPDIEALDIAVMEDAQIDAQIEQDDDSPIKNDAVMVKSFYNQATKIMQKEGVVMTGEEKESALGVSPKSTKQALDHQVPTHWNADHACIAAHLYFKTVVQSLTSVDSNKLQAYQLTDNQWDLAEDLNEVLKAEILLVVDVLPALYQL
ncbi:hypothetical protein BDZ94DRAFT_1240160 [Collybia nuda]|uniref:Uncharacterized protein n=1 Tax=Collybia nuda TaxID=64659 RepID=A0A9P5XX01_9AGAR|nr:hypothetical protein BDZ94DRAFT_1240160 [Collybia nuda]